MYGLGAAAVAAAAVAAGSSAFGSGGARALAQAGSGERAGADPGQASARAARTVYLTEKARLRFVSENGSTLIEHGHAYGTYDAPIVAHLTIHSKSVTASVTIYPKGGSIAGSAAASYKIVRNLGYFGGSLNLGRGSGRFSHIAEVRRKPLGISGIINRENFEVEVKANGEVAGL